MHCIVCFSESKDMLRFDGIIPNSKIKADKIRLSGAVHCFLMFVIETFSVRTLLWMSIKKVKRDED